MVILTAYGDENDIASGYVLGGNGYVRKPVDDAFAGAVKGMGLYWMVLNMPPPW